MPFDFVRMKKFFNLMLKIALGLTLIYALISYALFFSSGNWNPLSWPDFVMVIAFLILEWIGYLMINGKIRPQSIPQSRPQQRPRPQPKPEPIHVFNAPVQLSIGTCAICGKDVPPEFLRVFKDKQGNELYVCEDCIE